MHRLKRRLLSSCAFAVGVFAGWELCRISRSCCSASRSTAERSAKLSCSAADSREYRSTRRMRSTPSVSGASLPPRMPDLSSDQRGCSRSSLDPRGLAVNAASYCPANFGWLSPVKCSPPPAPSTHLCSTLLPSSSGVGTGRCALLGACAAVRLRRDARRRLSARLFPDRRGCSRPSSLHWPPPTPRLGTSSADRPYARRRRTPKLAIG